jgi:SAM-dependent methyltransferase
MSAEIVSDPNAGLVAEQYPPDDAAVNLARRWAVYEMAEEQINPLDVMYGFAMKHGVTSEGSVLDVGCNDAEDLRRLCLLGHKGKLLGVDPAVDPDSALLHGYAANGKFGGLGILPIQGPLEEVYIANKSIDLLLAKFMLYHVSDIEATLTRFENLLSDDGLLLVATSGAANKRRQHDEFEPLIAQSLGVIPPERFNARFTAEIAESLLPRYFNVADKYAQSTMASFDQDNVGVFVDSLMSMRNTFRPQPSKQEFLRAIDNVVLPKIMAEIALNGRFSEVIDRRFYVCKSRVLPQ